MAADNGQMSFRRGVMSLVILGLLKKEDMYGYQLVQETERRSGGRIVTQELLHNLRIRRRILGIVTCTALIVITLWAGTVTYAIIHNERLAHGYGVLGEIEVIERVEYTEGN